MSNYDLDDVIDRSIKRYEHAKALWEHLTVDERKPFCVAAKLPESKAKRENMPHLKALIDALCDELL